MNRKGFIFSFLSLIIAVVLISSLLIKDTEQDPEASGLHDHILSANNFLIQLEIDLSRVLQITSYRALIGLEEHTSNTGDYLTDVQAAFLEVITNGSINGTSYSVMDDATLDVFEQRMQLIGSNLGLDLNIIITNVSIGHVSPFDLQVNASMEVNMTTRDTNTMWSYSTVVTNIFDIGELKDPLYTVGTLGRVPIPIVMSNVTRPYITATNDTTRLQTLWNNTYFVEDPDGPSFLMRFMGDLNASQYGITSLVDTKTLESQDLTIYTDRSVVDHLYFANASTTTNTIVNMSSEFVLDDDHLALFDAVGKTT